MTTTRIILPLLAVTLLITSRALVRGAVSLHIGLGDSGESIRRVAAGAFQAEVLGQQRMHVSIAGPAQWGHPGASELELVRAVMAGDPPIALVNGATLSNFSSSFEVLDAPYLFTSRQHVVRVLYGPAGRAILDSLEPHGIVGLAFVGDTFRVLLSRAKTGAAPTLSGARVGTVQSASGELFVEALGGEAVPAPLLRLQEMARDGFIDGADVDPCSASAGKLWPVTPHVLETRHAVSTEVLIANPRFLEEFLPSERAVIWQGTLAAMRAANAAVLKCWSTAKKTTASRGSWTVLDAVQRAALSKRAAEARRAVLSRTDASILHDIELARPR